MTDKKLSPDAARAAIEADKESRKKQALEEITGILEKYNCRLDAIVVLSVNSIEPQIHIVAD